MLTRILLYFGLLICTPACIFAAPRHGISLSNEPAAPASLTAAKAAGFGVAQLRVDWPRLQPAPGTWDFHWLDGMVRQAATEQLPLALVLGPAPAWTVSYLRNPTPEQLTRARPDTAPLLALAATLAKRYGKKVAYYQPWERPSATTLLAGPADTQALFRAVARTIHEVDPALRVVMPEPGNVQLGWLADLLRCPPIERPDALLLAADATLPSHKLGMRMETLNARVLPAEGRPDVWASVPAGDTERGALFARLGVSTLLVAPAAADVPPQPLVLPAEAEPCAPTFTPPPIADDTVRLDHRGTDTARICPLPDLPRGTFARGTFLDRPMLCTIHATGPWIYLDVPDGFLFYNIERRPVEVSVTVAGVTRKERTGFSLLYDAVGGMKYSPWQWIDTAPPDAPAAFTYTVRLDDALFADSEGFDLRLEIGGSLEEVTLLDVAVTRFPAAAR